MIDGRRLPGAARAFGASAGGVGSLGASGAGAGLASFRACGTINMEGLPLSSRVQILLLGRQSCNLVLEY
jgi:hypothetical protein